MANLPGAQVQGAWGLHSAPASTPSPLSSGGDDTVGRGLMARDRHLAEAPRGGEHVSLSLLLWEIQAAVWPL